MQKLKNALHMGQTSATTTSSDVPAVESTTTTTTTGPYGENKMLAQDVGRASSNPLPSNIGGTSTTYAPSTSSNALPGTQTFGKLGTTDYQSGSTSSNALPGAQNFGKLGTTDYQSGSNVISQPFGSGISTQQQQPSLFGTTGMDTSSNLGAGSSFEQQLQRELLKRKQRGGIHESNIISEVPTSSNASSVAPSYAKYTPQPSSAGYTSGASTFQPSSTSYTSGPDTYQPASGFPSVSSAYPSGSNVSGYGSSFGGAIPPAPPAPPVNYADNYAAQRSLPIGQALRNSALANKLSSSAERSAITNDYSGRNLPYGMQQQQQQQQQGVSSRIAPSSLQTQLPATSVVQAPVRTTRYEKPTVVQETIHPMERVETQPIVSREREQLEVHQITQPMKETKILPEVIRQSNLPLEDRGVISRGTQQQNIPSGASEQSFVREASPVTERIEKPPIVREVIRKKIIEEVQPVIYREVIQPERVQIPQQKFEKVYTVPLKGIMRIPAGQQGQQLQQQQQPQILQQGIQQPLGQQQAFLQPQLLSQQQSQFQQQPQRQILIDPQSLWDQRELQQDLLNQQQQQSLNRNIGAGVLPSQFLQQQMYPQMIYPQQQFLMGQQPFMLAQPGLSGYQVPVMLVPRQQILTPQQFTNQPIPSQQSWASSDLQKDWQQQGLGSQQGFSQGQPAELRQIVIDNPQQQGFSSQQGLGSGQGFSQQGLAGQQGFSSNLSQQQGLGSQQGYSQGSQQQGLGSQQQGFSQQGLGSQQQGLGSQQGFSQGSQQQGFSQQGLGSQQQGLGSQQGYSQQGLGSQQGFSQQPMKSMSSQTDQSGWGNQQQSFQQQQPLSYGRQQQQQQQPNSSLSLPIR